MPSVHEKSVENDMNTVEHVEGGVSSGDVNETSSILATVATVGVVGAGVAVLEAALLPGLVLGVAAVAAPSLLPRLGSAISPIFRSAVRGVYMAGRKTREIVAEAQEHVNDIVAEVDSEGANDVEIHSEARKA